MEIHVSMHEIKSDDIWMWYNVSSFKFRPKLLILHFPLFFCWMSLHAANAKSNYCYLYSIGSLLNAIVPISILTHEYQRKHQSVSSFIFSTGIFWWQRFRATVNKHMLLKFKSASYYRICVKKNNKNKQQMSRKPEPNIYIT